MTGQERAAEIIRRGLPGKSYAQVLVDNLERFMYMADGNAVQFIAPVALKWCKGIGLDVGGTKEWTLPGAIRVNLDTQPYSATNLPPQGPYDFVFSSHALEHLGYADARIRAMSTWIGALKPGGVLFLYLPHRNHPWWHPSVCQKHFTVYDQDQIGEEFQQALDGTGRVARLVMSSGPDLACSISFVAVID